MYEIEEIAPYLSLVEGGVGNLTYIGHLRFLNGCQTNNQSMNCSINHFINQTFNQTIYQIPPVTNQPIGINNLLVDTIY